MLATKSSDLPKKKKRQSKTSASKSAVCNYIKKGFVQFGSHPSVKVSEVVQYLSVSDLKQAYLKALKSKKRLENGTKT